VGVTSYTHDASTAPHRLATRRQVGRIANLFAIWLIVLAAAGLGQLASSLFLSTTNILNMLSQSSVLGITAMGVTFVMLAGELDVSNAGVVTVSAVAAAGVMGGNDTKIPLGILAALGIGAGVGLFNGILVARGVQSFILTLAVGIVLLGSAIAYTGGTTLGNVAPSYTSFFFKRAIADIPMPAIALFVALGAAFLLERFTRFGHRVIMIGANPSAAYLSGVKITSTLIGAYVTSGVAAALAGLVFLGRTGVPNDFGGMGLEFQALAAAVVGGTALSGGRGSVLGTFAGTLLLTISLTIGLIIGWPYATQLIEYGGLIVVASLVYSLLRRDTAR
jgi:ribose transport system permease protein